MGHCGSIQVKRLCVCVRKRERDVEGRLGGGQFQGDKATGTEVKVSRIAEGTE